MTRLKPTPRTTYERALRRRNRALRAVEAERKPNKNRARAERFSERFLAGYYSDKGAVQP